MPTIYTDIQETLGDLNFKNSKGLMVLRNLALTKGALVTPFNLVDEGTVLIKEGKIIASGPSEKVAIPHDYEEVPLEGLIIVPGFIDQHLHGGAGASVMDAEPQSFLDIARFHATHGVTSFLATTVSSSRDRLVAVAKAYAEYKRISHKGAQCLGLNLEGPYLSGKYGGIHPAATFRPPSVEEILTINRISDNGVKMITIAPELMGALNVAKDLRETEVVCAIGHSDADYETALAAVTVGFKCVTHCFNGLRPFFHREPGVLGAALTCNDLEVELIADRHHLHQVALELAWKMKGPEKIILISDAMAPTGMSPGIYQTSEGNMHLNEDRLTDDQGRLAGSVLTLDKAVKNFMEDTGCELTDVIRMVTYNPAHLLGINKKKGSLYPGKDADLVVLTPDFEIVLTMVGGEVISGLITID